MDASARPLAELRDVSQYEAFVVGSAVHDQQWLTVAHDFLDRFGPALARHPVWLFSVSSVGETTSFFGPKLSKLIRRTRHADPVVAAASKALVPREHHHFAGALQRGDWSRLGDFLLKLCGGNVGDQRDWQDVDAWADGIARTIQKQYRARERRRLHLMVRGKP